MTTNDPAPAVPVGVHDHGAEDGPGLACNESRLPDGSLRGACLGPVGVQPEPAEAHWWWVRHAQAHPECREGTYLHTDHTPAAVPVVHPEPAEEAEPLVALVECQPEPECQRADTWAGSWCVVHGGTWPCISTSAPAVPVVHPEPGDRADRVQCIVCSTYVPESRIEPVVAAAVAAVRADTEAALALHTGLHQCVGGSWYSDNDPTYHGTVARHTPCPTAAALRGLS